MVESFDKNFKFETISILYDSIAETIISVMDSQVEQEINFLNDLSVYVDKYYDYLETGNINYGISDEIIYLNAYNNLYYNDRKDYDEIFKFTHSQKYDLIHGNNNISMRIEVDFVDSAIVVDIVVVNFDMNGTLL